MAFVVCDLNGLKHVNDTLGHSAGNEFIGKTCSTICDVFCHSPVFRIGGEAFAVILQERDFDNRVSLVKRLSDTLDSQKHKGIRPLAFGISEYDRLNRLAMWERFPKVPAGLVIGWFLTFSVCSCALYGSFVC